MPSRSFSLPSRQHSSRSMVMSFRIRETLEHAMALKVLSPLMSIRAARVRKRSERLVLRDMGERINDKSEIRNQNDESSPNDEIRMGFYSVILVSGLIRYSD